MVIIPLTCPRKWLTVFRLIFSIYHLDNPHHKITSSSLSLFLSFVSVFKPYQFFIFFRLSPISSIFLTYFPLFNFPSFHSISVLHSRGYLLIGLSFIPVRINFPRIYSKRTAILPPLFLILSTSHFWTLSSWICLHMKRKLPYKFCDYKFPKSLSSWVSCRSVSSLGFVILIKSFRLSVARIEPMLSGCHLSCTFTTLARGPQCVCFYIMSLFSSFHYIFVSLEFSMPLPTATQGLLKILR